MVRLLSLQLNWGPHHSQDKGNRGSDSSYIDLRCPGLQTRSLSCVHPSPPLLSHGSQSGWQEVTVATRHRSALAEG